jgi:O-antigen/teichoic acid export membrane protein
VVVLGAVGRHLGVEQFGQLNYAINLAAIFGAVASLGFDGIVIREMVRAPADTPRLLCTAFGMRLVGGLFAVLLALLVSMLSGDSSLGTTLVVLIAVGFLPGAFEVLELWFQKNIQAKFTVAARIGSALVAGILRLLLVWHGASLVAFAVMQAVEAALAAAALVWVFHARGESMRGWRFDGVAARRILRDCWPLILSGVLVAVYYRVEQILVKTVLGDYSLGIYYASVRVTDMWSFIPAVILATIFPLLVEGHLKADPVRSSQRLQLVFDLLTMLGLATAVAVTVLAKFLVPLVFGAEYASAAMVLMIHAWMAPVAFSGSVRAQFMLLENITIFHTFAAGLGILINIPLALWLMQKFGVNGAALAVVSTTWFTGFGTSFIFPKLRSCGILQARALLAPFRLPEIAAALKRQK